MGLVRKILRVKIWIRAAVIVRSDAEAGARWISEVGEEVQEDVR